MSLRSRSPNPWTLSPRSELPGPRVQPGQSLSLPPCPRLPSAGAARNGQPFQELGPGPSPEPPASPYQCHGCESLWSILHTTLRGPGVRGGVLGGGVNAALRHVPHPRHLGCCGDRARLGARGGGPSRPSRGRRCCVDHGGGSAEAGREGWGWRPPQDESLEEGLTAGRGSEPQKEVLTCTPLRGSSGVTESSRGPWGRVTPRAAGPQHGVICPTRAGGPLCVRTHA